MSPWTKPRLPPPAIPNYKNRSTRAVFYNVASGETAPMCFDSCSSLLHSSPACCGFRLTGSCFRGRRYRTPPPHPICLTVPYHSSLSHSLYSAISTSTAEQTYLPPIAYTRQTHTLSTSKNPNPKTPQKSPPHRINHMSIPNPQIRNFGPLCLT